MVHKQNKKKGNQTSESTMHLIDSKDIAYDFSIKAYKKFKEVIKSIILFGSVPKKGATLESDIDILIIVDDATIKWDDELIGWYRTELAKLIAENKYIKKIHINTVTMTTFWDDIRRGEPITINVLRYGETLIDYGGFFEPLKSLLAKGKIYPTPEAVFTALERSNGRIIQANVLILDAIQSLYWAMVDVSHSALMSKKITPPSPEFIPELLTQVFVKEKILNNRYVEWFLEVRKISKAITYGELKSVSSQKLDELRSKANDYVKVLGELTEYLIKNEKIIKIEEKK